MMLQRSRRPLTRCLERIALFEAQNLQLPFLCPSILAPPKQKRAASSTAKHASEQGRQSPRRQIKHQTASFVTDSSLSATATPTGYLPSGEDPIPFGPPPTTPFPDRPQHGPQHIPAMHGYDTNSSPLILNDTPVTSVGNYYNLYGVSGDINDMHQTLYACLQVGRLERAAALVRRLNLTYKPDAPGLLAAHTDYLREATLDVIRSKDWERLDDLVDWFEKEIHRFKIPLNETLLGLMIHACLQIPSSSSAQHMKHFYNLAHKAGVTEDTERMVAELEAAMRLDDLTEEAVTERYRPVSSLNRQFLESLEESQPVELKAVKLKGEGLRSLRKSLAFLHRPVEDKHGQIIDPDKLSDTEKQQLLEQTTVEAATERWRIENEKLKKLGINSSLSEKSPVGAMMWNWYEQLVPQIREELHLMDLAHKKDVKARTLADEERVLCGPYLQQISPEKAAAVTVVSVMTDLTLVGQANLSSVLTHLAAELQCEVYRNKQSKGGRDSAWRKISRQQSNAQERRLKNAFSRFNFSATSMDHELAAWPQNVGFKIGAKLLSRFSKLAKFDVYRTDAGGNRHAEAHPAVFHTYAYIGGRKTGILKLNKVLEDKVRAAPVGTALAKHLPMLCEPRPWQTYREGGFLTQNDTVIRMQYPDTYSMAYLKAASKNGDLDQVFDGLNILGRVPWVVNRQVFDVMADAWNKGEKIASIPPANPEYNVDPPPEPSTPKQQKAWREAVEEARNHVGGLKSQRAFQNFQLEIARAFMGQKLYFPHSFDFRGRAYPMPPILNHMGADHARGLLKFADGKKLGTSGLWWLKVHLANLYGFDKASFLERSKFAEDHAENIKDSATKPLTGSRWWLQAEDPWQCLAVCFELHAASQLPDPTEFISSVPVHQDGTCNGLQHYAALGGDIVGAQQVNLEPGERPSDIYTHVARMIEKEIRAEAAQGDETAKLIEDRITRKIVKQTVMTNVYGVTLRGARDQVSRQLEDIFPIAPSLTKKNLDVLATYIAKKIFKALANMFGGAHHIQLWFGQCANRICESISQGQLLLLDPEAALKDTVFDDHLQKKPRVTQRSNNPSSYMTPVVWTTPLKLPVVQPYRIPHHSRCKTEMQSLHLGQIDGASPVHKKRQLQGFPPNFIHSLDGTHMILTALRSNELGLKFAAVHDSFWTHACDVDTLNLVTRDAFIRMHGEDVIARLAAEFEARYKGHVRLTWVDANNPAAEEIMAWRLANRSMLKSKQAKLKLKDNIKHPSEMLLEGKRIRLLSSTDPEEQKQGREMVTPASIVEKFMDQSALPEDEPISARTLGQTEGSKEMKAAILDRNPSEDSILDPLDESEVGNEASDEVTDAHDITVAADTIAKTPTKRTEKKAKKPLEERTGRTHFWTGLTFPPVPKKGEFDIRRLKDSMYFFS